MNFQLNEIICRVDNVHGWPTNSIGYTIKDIEMNFTCKKTDYKKDLLSMI